jgi:hypothetical protein
LLLPAARSSCPGASAAGEAAARQGASKLPSLLLLLLDLGHWLNISLAFAAAAAAGSGIQQTVE